MVDSIVQPLGTRLSKVQTLLSIIKLYVIARYFTVLVYTNLIRPETHKELKSVPRVHSVRIFSFAKYHIWQHKELLRK